MYRNIYILIMNDTDCGNVHNLFQANLSLFLVKFLCKEAFLINSKIYGSKDLDTNVWLNFNK
jgi:hypothetical protein